MKTHKTFELELTRNNVTPAQFLAYVRSMTKKHDISFDMSMDDFARNDEWVVNYTNALPSEKPCAAERCIDKAFDKQTYIRNFDGTTYNEIIEFQFDDDKTGFGYYYTVQVDVDEADAAANTEEQVASIIKHRTEKAERQEAKAAKLEAIADEEERRGYASQTWIDGQRTDAKYLRFKATATREAIAKTIAETANEADETTENVEIIEATETTETETTTKFIRVPAMATILGKLKEKAATIDRMFPGENLGDVTREMATQFKTLWENGFIGSYSDEFLGWANGYKINFPDFDFHVSDCLDIHVISASKQQARAFAQWYLNA